MATRRTRTAIGGATAAVAIGVFAIVAFAAPGLTAPALTNNPTVPVTWTPESPEAVYGLQRTGGACPVVGGTALAINPGDSSFNDTPGDGVWCYTLTAADMSASNAQVRVDTTPPTAPMFSSPPPGSAMQNPIAIAAAGSADGGGSGVASTTLSVDGLGPLITTPGASASFQWGATDGTYTLRAVSTDAAGNPSPPATVSVTVDNTPPPVFTVIAPSPVAGAPTLSWPSGPYTYTVTRDGTAVPGTISSPWTDPAAPAPGNHTYVVTATDAALNQRTSTVSVQVVPTSATQPRSLAAPSPTNAAPHLTWEKPSTYAVTGWEVFRDGASIATIGNPDTMNYDDASVGAQGPHTYAVRALSGANHGDTSSAVSVIYDTVAPSFGAPTAVPVQDGTVGLSWQDAQDPAPGSGVMRYVVRRGTSVAADPQAGTSVCTIALPAATGCVDTNTLSGSNYVYSVFAVDGAGNETRQTASARAIDTVGPDRVAGFRGSVGPTNVHLLWDPPARQGNDADLARFRIIRLTTPGKMPANPTDGSEVCPGLGARDRDCFVQRLATGKRVSFAIYAVDEVPNYSTPAIVTVTPRGDGTNPHRATKVRVKRAGARITMTWISPKDSDLSHFVLNLNKKGPAKNPGVRPIVFKGRKLKASFTLRAGQTAYANLFSVDLSGNFARVTRKIVMPKTLAVPKKKKAVKKTVPKKTAPKKTVSAKATVPAKQKPGAVTVKPVPVKVEIG